MDALYGFTLAGALGWFLGFSGGSLRKLNAYRRAEYERECAVNLARAIERRDGPRFTLAQYRAARAERLALYGDPRLGPVSRDNDGAGLGDLSAGRAAHIADAAALT